MERQDAIRKIKAMRNPNGRTADEAKSFRAKADAIQAAHGISESELTQVSTFEMWFGGRPAQPERSPEAAEAIRMAREAAWMASEVARMAREKAAREARARASSFAQDARSRMASKKSPRRGAFEGTVPKGFVNPQRIRDLMGELGIRTNGELAKMAGVSPSLVSEWMGKGRGRLLHETIWTAVYEPAIRKAAAR